MFLKTIQVIFLVVLVLSITGLGIGLITRIITGNLTRVYTYTVLDVPSSPVAIVFGAGLWHNGQPTPVLRDRVTAAADLYFQGKVEQILMSGDNRFLDYNEPESMKKYAISLGMPSEKISLDYAGRSTYETCYRAKRIFQIEEAILVTQSFHLPRAIFTCRSLGIQAVGVDADRRDYRRLSLIFWNAREIPATLNAFWQLYVVKPAPVLGKSEPIFPWRHHESR